MKNKNGFTLTEILLAVMIVGIIGVALASLTTAASRESGVGRSRLVMRDNLSLAMRQLRQDMHKANQVLYVHGKVTTTEASTATPVPLLLLSWGTMSDGTTQLGTDARYYVTYCFVPGAVTKLADGSTNVLPSGAKDGGTIYRRGSTSYPFMGGNSPIPNCSGAGTSNDFKVFLQNVKFIPPSTNYKYPVPLFSVTSDDSEIHQASAQYNKQNLGSWLQVNLIVEAPTLPVVNDVTEEIFVSPNGFYDIQPQP